MRYFITGATGFIGGRLARMLVASGHEVRALVRDPARAGDLRAAGIELAAGDITERASLREPMTGVDGVFHVAGWYKIGRPDETAAHAINVEGTRNVLETMRDLAIPKGVYTSTLAVFGNTHGKLPDEGHRVGGPWLSVYDRTKWQAHYLVAEPLAKAGLPLVTVMPGLVYGPGDTSALHTTWQQFLNRRLPAVPRGTAYCWAHVDDIARGHLLAMELGKPGQDYIIAGPAHTILQALRAAERLTGIPLRAPRVPAWPLKMSSWLVRPFDRILPLPDTMTSEGLRVIAGVTYLGSNAKAKRDLGFDPRPLESGLPETLAWEMEQLGMAVPGRLRAY